MSVLTKLASLVAKPLTWGAAGLSGSQDSTFAGEIQLEIQGQKHSATQFEIISYTRQSDAYLVIHADGVKLWFDDVDLIEARVLVKWTEYKAYQARIESESHILDSQKLETVSTESEWVSWGDTSPHNLALINDGYVVQGGPDVFDNYPPRAKKNNSNVPQRCSISPGIKLMCQTPI